MVDATHVAVGFSNQLLTELDALLPAESVLVLEEPEISALRGVPDLLKEHPCVAELALVPSQAEHDPMALVQALPRPAGVVSVLPSIEYGVVGAAALAENWGLPGAGLKAAASLRDKASLRAAVAGTAVAQPVWTQVAGPAELAAFHAANGGRSVLKPTRLQASLGVQRLGPADDPGPAWERTAGADEVERRARYAAGNRYLAEQWLNGPEVSVECLVHDGAVGFLNVTGKLVADQRFPVELGHVVPAALDRRVDAALRRSVAELVAAIGYRSGILHSEWILVDGVPHLVECAGRLPGDRIDSLIDLAYGRRLVPGWLSVLAGIPMPPLPAASAAAVRFVTAPPGEVVAVTGVDEARALPWVVEVDIPIERGDLVSDVVSSYERCGYVLVSEQDSAGAEELARRVAESITISVR
jgi:biotin carboxylase